MERLKNFIKSHPMLSVLSDGDIENLLINSKEIILEKNKCLFSRGDLSESLFIVLSGKMSAFIDEKPVVKNVAHLGAGDLIGELGLWEHSTRTLSIKALENSKLIEIPYTSFYPLLVNHPRLHFVLSQLVIRRFKEVMSKWSDAQNLYNIVMLPIHEGDNDVTNLYHKIKDTITSSSVTEYWAQEDIINYHLNDHHSAMEFISRAEPNIKIRLFCLSDTSHVFTQSILKRCDRVYLVASNDLRERGVCAKRRSQIKDYLNADAKTSLVILYNHMEKVHRETRTWLGQFDYHDNYHICLGKRSSDTDIKRLIRYITGTSVSLVLSGGGTRGWAHVGAIRALLENNIPIDHIAGTSSGGGFASLYAKSQDTDLVIEHAKYLMLDVKNLFNWRNFTLPFMSLFSYSKNTRKLQVLFDGLYIEDLQIPFFCTSTNLNKLSVNVHDQGPVWEAIRASVAIPGLWGPMNIDGDIYVDGGVINNLPTDIMRNKIAPGSKVIAVDVGHMAYDDAKYNFPPDVGFMESLGMSLKLTGRQYKMPKISDIILKSYLLGPVAINNNNRTLADVLVIPRLGDYSFTSQKHWEKLIELGYEETMRVLQLRDIF